MAAPQAGVRQIQAGEMDNMFVVLLEGVPKYFLALENTAAYGVRGLGLGSVQVAGIVQPYL